MVVDNHYVRSLLGPDVYCLPNGAPTDEHMRRALLVPQQFDVIAVVEDAAGTDVLVQQGLGWGTRLNSIRKMRQMQESVGCSTSTCRIYCCSIGSQLTMRLQVAAPHAQGSVSLPANW